jgi:hypothetical protein
MSVVPPSQAVLSLQHILVNFIVTVTKHLTRNNVRGERFILAHGFREFFQFIVAWPQAFGQNIMAAGVCREEAVYLMVDRK